MGGIPRQVCRLQGDGAIGRVTDKVVAARGDHAETIGAMTAVRGHRIEGEDSVLQYDCTIEVSYATTVIFGREAA